MVVGELAEPVDLLVVGGGPGGYVAALRAAELGREVTLVDRDGERGLGGACLHVGCIPSKALIELAGTYHRVQSGAIAGLSVEGGAVDLPAFQASKGELVAGIARGVAGLLSRAGIRVVQGSLRFNRPDRAAVEQLDGSVRFLEFRDAIVATGSRPAALPALPVDGERTIDSTGALALDALPASLAVVGAGTIGLELGIAYAKLGVRVTIVEALERILPGVDRALTQPVLRRMDALGIEVALSSRAVGLDGDALVYERPDGSASCPAERVLVAIGRTPNTDTLGLEQTGVACDEQGLIVVDAQRRAAPHVAAIGDVVSGPALAHKASAEARVAAEALCGRASAFEPAAIPLVVFSDPEIASAGLTEDQARAAGLDVRSASFPFSASGRAATLGERDGFAQVVAERRTERVAGVHVVGPHASELIAEGALAVELLAAPEDLARTIHPHPTLSEALAEAAAALQPIM